MTIQRPRGTRDLLPEETWRRYAARNAMQDVLKRWGYQEIVTPTFEHLELFTLKSGNAVIEEIYSFKDKGGRDLALRPELTAPVMRMYVSKLQNAPKPQRLFYYGNCFRYERPQRGRFREFWQLGAELIGGARPDSEAEVIALADETLTSVGIEGDIHVGYLGLIRHILAKIAPEHRANILRMIDKKEREHLKEFLEDVGCSHLGLLELIELKGEEALDKAVEIFRDLKGFEDKASSIRAMSKARLYDNHSNGGRTSARFGKEWKAEQGIEEFQEMIVLLEAYDVEFTIDFEIVRGLEYYSGTVFEIYAAGLGAQHQVCGGGSYELASVFGGAKTNSTGFGLGFDRIMEIAKTESIRKPPLFLIFTPDVKAEAIGLAKQLRYRIPVILDVMGRDLGAQLKSARNAGTEYVIIVGRTELDSGKYTFRNMNNGQQQSLTLTEITKMMAIEYGVNKY
jgi:histidyl-tRNA synthetase